MTVQIFVAEAAIVVIGQVGADKCSIEEFKLIVQVRGSFLPKGEQTV